MSLKPITEIDALNDKALNLYANTITANEINGAGTVDFKDIECETITSTVRGEFTGDLVATGSTVQLRGGSIPSSTGVTAGHLLTNTDGNGNLQWTDASALFPASLFPTSGVYQPNPVASAGTLSTWEAIAYTLIGNQLTIAGNVNITLPVASGFTLTMDLLSGYVNTTDAVFLTACGGRADNVTDNNVMSIDSSPVGTDKFQIEIATTRNTSWTAQLVKIFFTGIITVAPAP